MGPADPFILRWAYTQRIFYLYVLLIYYIIFFIACQILSLLIIIWRSRTYNFGIAAANIRIVQSAPYKKSPASEDAGDICFRPRGTVGG